VITRRLALNEVRRMRRRRLFALRHREEIGPSAAVPDAVDEEVRAEVESAIASLPPRQREVFILSRYHRLTHTEIAETLSISAATVSNQMTSALRHLRRRLAPVADRWLPVSKPTD
jgi:RNA polymerase sigma-70 factor, ECF subfamily